MWELGAFWQPPSVPLASYWFTHAFVDYYLTNYVHIGQAYTLQVPSDTNPATEIIIGGGPLAIGHFPYGQTVTPDVPG